MSEFIDRLIVNITLMWITGPSYIWCTKLIRRWEEKYPIDFKGFQLVYWQ